MTESNSKKVKTFNKYYEDYKAAPGHSTEERQALEGMAATAVTKEQLILVARKAPLGTKMEKQAIMKLANMAEDMVTLIDVAKLSAYDSELRRNLEKVMTERAETRADWCEIYMYAECGSKLEALAREKKNSMT